MPEVALNWLTASPSSRRRREASDCRTRRCAPTSRRPTTSLSGGGRWPTTAARARVLVRAGDARSSRAERERDEAEAVAEEAEEELRAVRARGLQLGGDLLKRTEELADLRAAKTRLEEELRKADVRDKVLEARAFDTEALLAAKDARRRVGGAARSGAPSGRRAARLDGGARATWCAPSSPGSRASS